MPKPEPTYPTAPNPNGGHTPTPPGPGSGAGTGAGTGSGAGSGSGTGSGSTGGYLAAQRRMERRAANAYMQQAGMLNEQIDALRDALDGGFLAALHKRLKNVRLVTRQQDRTLVQAYEERVKDLKGAHKDNVRAAADQSAANQVNLGRERASQVSEAMLQGAGESDVLRTQQMALRNWDANQGEVQRSYFDTLRSINTNLTDLNMDTKTARQNVVIESNADIEQLWTGYYAQMSEANTDLGNVLGQQATLYSQAGQYGAKGANKKRKRAAHLMGEAFDEASDQISKAWENPGIPKKLRQWDGRDPFKRGSNNMGVYRETNGPGPLARPEGATLREW